jgi:hypothetical protein
MSRLTWVSYTSEAVANTCDTSAYNQTALGYVLELTNSEYGIPPWHWRSTKTIGSGVSTTYYDARLNPVLVITEDLANSATKSFIVNRYDAMGERSLRATPSVV